MEKTVSELGREGTATTGPLAAVYQDIHRDVDAPFRYKDGVGVPRDNMSISMPLNAISTLQSSGFATPVIDALHEAEVH